MTGNGPVMPQPTQRPTLLGVTPDSVPHVLRCQPRWACWRAEWNEKRGKYDKIPCHPQGYGLSTKRPEAWVSF